MEDDDFKKATSLLPANMCVYRKIYIWSDRPHHDVIMLQGRGKKMSRRKSAEAFREINHCIFITGQLFPFAPLISLFFFPLVSFLGAIWDYLCLVFAPFLSTLYLLPSVFFFLPR